ncbi:CDP-diacylglycerol--glycerol-3-phosphate 3-phosphatidyltransferase [Metamycoplasma spumans]|uniref:CDP-diacylglycerol--glycerol-3-phosphate 3-phosphatidyltransferase n=1 Tax=Metamycoplasma spumans TaxID=92406 RepID=UPI000A05B607
MPKIKQKKHLKSEFNNHRKRSHFGVANWLTALRLLLMIPFIILMTAAATLIIKGEGTFYYKNITLASKNANSLAISIIYWLNVIIFMVAMMTDWIDGYYARKTNTVSSFGKVFDPIADKVATTLMMIFLAIVDFTYLPVVVLFIVRDILVDGSRVYAAKKNVKVAANWWGKVKTIIVSFALVAISFAGPWLKSNELSILYLNLPLIVGLIIAWISGIIYMSKYLKGITKNTETTTQNNEENQQKSQAENLNKNTKAVDKPEDNLKQNKKIDSKDLPFFETK